MMMMTMQFKCVLGEGRAVPIFGEICSSRPIHRTAHQFFEVQSIAFRSTVCHCLPLCATHPHYRALSLCTGTAASGAAPGVVTRCRGNRRQIKTSPVSDLLARALHFLTSFGPFLGFLAPISSSQRQQEDQKLTPADIRPRQSTKISNP